MFDIHQSIYDESGERDEDRLEEYQAGLLEDFVASSEGIACLKDKNWPHWAEMFLDYYFGYIGDNVAEMSKSDVEEVIFQLIPEKVSTEPEDASEIIAEMHAFWSYLGREFQLKQAPQILALFTDDAITELRAELANPRNYGMAKSMFMTGKQAGFDMTTQEGLDAFMMDYNSRLLNDMIPYERDAILAMHKDRLAQDLPPPIGPNKSRKLERKKKKQQRQARKRNRR
jgi:hypothetical protein